MPTQVMLIAWADGASTTACTFTVSVDGAPPETAGVREDGVAVFAVPDDAASVHVTATAAGDVFWPVSAGFVRAADGTLVAGEGGAPAEFLVGQPIVDAGVTTGVIFAFLSRLRDATPEALASLQSPPAVRQGTVGPPPSAWAPVAETGLSVTYLPFVGPGTTGANQLNLGPLDVTPDGEWVVFEIAGVTAPRTIAVCWPSSVPRTPEAAASPFLLYLHPNVSQNAPTYYTHPQVGSYPFGFDYIYFGFWRYLVYLGDPLTWDPYCKALPTQIASSGRAAVLVLPGNKVGPEIASMLDAGFTDTLLRDLQGVMFRRASVYAAPPGLGRVALASFSAGNGLITQFLDNPANQQHAFYLDNLRELYLFEAPGDVGALVRAAKRWQAAGSSGDKRIEVFAQSVKAAYRELAPAVPGMPSTSTDGQSTVTYAPPAAWNTALTQVGNPNGLTVAWQEAHQLISALCLTDALSRSGF